MFLIVAMRDLGEEEREDAERDCSYSCFGVQWLSYAVLCIT